MTPKPRKGKDVTICVAVLFQWNYAPPGSATPSWGPAALTASDRKITAGDVEYEPQQLKVAFLNQRALILISGDYAFHTEAILATQRQVQSKPDLSPENIALNYGRTIQSIKRRHAEDLILAPLGMNTDTFVAQQRELSEGFVERITSQLQNYVGEEVEALVVAGDGKDVFIYSIDTRGAVICLNDVGFAAIGGGAWHAKSRLMQAGYVNRNNFPLALPAIFAAKKAAEVAPGVGKSTDIYLVLRDTIDPLRPDVAAKLPEFYEEYQLARAELEKKLTTTLHEFMMKPQPESEPTPQQDVKNDKKPT